MVVYRDHEGGGTFDGGPDMSDLEKRVSAVQRSLAQAAMVATTMLVKKKISKSQLHKLRDSVKIVDQRVTDLLDEIDKAG